MGYRLLVMLADDTDFTLEEFEKRLKKNKPLSEAKVERDGDSIKITIDKFSFDIGVSSEPSVVEESAEIAAQFASDRKDKSKIAACKRRIEFESHDDPNLDYFNDYLFVTEEIEAFKGVYIFDPQAGEFV
jgi:hypothetical protein